MAAMGIRREGEKIRAPRDPDERDNRMKPVDEQQVIGLCDALIHTRQHIGPKHLAEPAPTEAQLRELFAAAAAAPDHHQLLPWRFLVLGEAARQTLSEAFAAALLARDPAALPDQVEDARNKAFRGPVLIMAVVDLRADKPEVHACERVVSLGAAIQNLLLAARARGFGSGLSSGRALHSPQLREAFGIAEGEHAVCFISLGTPLRSKAGRQRPAVDAFVRWI
jgi:nitroreductase